MDGDNIKIDLQEIEWGTVDWIGLAQAGSNEQVNEPSGSIKCGEFLD